ncbi:MAG: hypothetical protein R3Y36_04460 [Spirochaetales bacterium]
MKKTILTLTLLCVALTLHALDYRQVIFGNSYENIIEIDADDFFEQYPEVKEHCKPYTSVEANEKMYLPNYYRVYEQIIGSKTFYRLLISYENYADIDFLDWKESVYFSQYVFYKESELNLLQLGDVLFFCKYYLGMGTRRIYEGLEIIERNNTVVGLMSHQLSVDYYETKNFAYYCIWEEARKSAVAKTDTINYVRWNLERNNTSGRAESIYISIIAENKTGERVAGSVLVDTKRPFMYTIQNAFDGNPKTSYVEDTYNDLFTIMFEMSEIVDLTALKIINGYADEKYYYENNRIANINMFSGIYVQLHETCRSQLIELDITNESFFFLDFNKVYLGSKYNDTALAEFDLYVKDEGWLFGGLE